MAKNLYIKKLKLQILKYTLPKWFSKLLLYANKIDKTKLVFHTFHPLKIEWIIWIIFSIYLHSNDLCIFWELRTHIHNVKKKIQFWFLVGIMYFRQYSTTVSCLSVLLTSEIKMPLVKVLFCLLEIYFFQSCQQHT